MTAKSSYLIGSHASWPDTTVTIDPTPGTPAPSAETISASLGGLYVTHATSTLSGTAQLLAALTAAGVGSAAVELLDSGKIKISGGATFSVTWTDALGAAFFGFDGSALTGASSYTADEISKYIWVAGRGHTPTESPIGVGGAINYMRRQTEATDGSQVTFVHGSTRTTETLRFDVVPKALFETADGLGGEFSQFWSTVLVGGAHFQHYEYENYTSTGTTALSLGTALGPYVMRGKQGTRPFRRNAGAPRVDKYYDLSLSMLQVPEYS